MLNLYSLKTKKTQTGIFFDEGEKLSIVYHNLFDYPLSLSDLGRWRAKDSGKKISDADITSKKGFYFLQGKEEIVFKRILRQKISAQKMEIAKAAAKKLSAVPFVKMVAVTGSLAMENPAEESDIDLMIVTRHGTLWMTRLFYLICLIGQIRRSGEKEQKDKLCLNIWLDESDLKWKEKNIYSAHEIAQIVPLVNKNKTYEKFLSENKWILKFWPDSVKIPNSKHGILDKKLRRFMDEDSKFKLLKGFNVISDFVLRTSDFIAFKIQFLYMRKKITREVISPTRALFHPQDWGKVVLDRLNSYFVE